MIKYATLAFVAVLSLQLVLADLAKGEEHNTGVGRSHKTIYEKEAYKYQMRERLGHFRLPPFVEVYKHYSFAFNKDKYPKGDVDDYRNFLVTADQCRVFFAKFVARKFTLPNLEQMVVLDGCLGYVMDEKEFFTNDPESSDECKRQLATYRNMPKLQELYKSDIDSLGAAERTCIADLLFSSITARLQYPKVKCNNHMLQMYIQFAECQSDLVELHKRKQTDPYVKLVYDLVKEIVQGCFAAEIKHLNNRMKFDSSKQLSYKLMPGIISSAAHNKGKDRNWSKPVVEVFLAIQGLKPKQEISLREATKLVSGVNREDELSYDRLLENVGKYATEKLKPRNNGDEELNDFGIDNYQGEGKYTELIDNLCKHFRSTDRADKYDYALSLVRIVRLLKYEDVFGISEIQMIRDVVMYANESSAVYICVAACNLLTFTQGYLEEVSPTGQYQYKVTWKADLGRMIKWPQPSYI